MSDHYCCKICGQRYDKCLCVAQYTEEKSQSEDGKRFPLKKKNNKSE